MPADAGTLLLPIAFVAVFYFLVMRPQRKRQQQHAALVRGLGIGDAVVTIGGLHGEVVAFDDDTMDLQVYDDVVLRFQRSSIAKVVTDEPVVDDVVDSVEADGSTTP